MNEGSVKMCVACICISVCMCVCVCVCVCCAVIPPLMFPHNMFLNNVETHAQLDHGPHVLRPCSMVMALHLEYVCSGAHHTIYK